MSESPAAGGAPVPTAEMPMEQLTQMGGPYWSRDHVYHELYTTEVTRRFNAAPGSQEKADPTAVQAPPGPPAPPSPVDAPPAPDPAANLRPLTAADLPALGEGEEYGPGDLALANEGRSAMIDLGVSDEEARHWLQQVLTFDASEALTPEEGWRRFEARHGAQAGRLLEQAKWAFQRLPTSVRAIVEARGLDNDPTMATRLAQLGAPLLKAAERLAAIQKDPGYLDGRHPNHRALVEEAFRQQQVVHGRR